MPCRRCGKNSGRAVGEIGEAPPVADAARRFRGSAPIGGRDSGRESVGTTVGNRRPLRKRYKRYGEVRNPPVTASPCQPPLGKGAEGTGERIATAGLRTGLAMTRFFARGAMGGPSRTPAPTEGLQEVQWAGDRKGRPYGVLQEVPCGRTEASAPTEALPIGFRRVSPPLFSTFPVLCVWIPCG